MGTGSELPAFTVRRHGVTSVDVNEQNPAALKFYRKHGFAVDGRSPLDDQGNPFPILHRVEKMKRLPSSRRTFRDLKILT